MKKILIIALLNIVSLSVFAGCASAIRIDGPYRGRIIDAETKQPMEGVVVLGVWDRETPTAAGAIHEYYDATETVTDKNGDFEIKGLGLLVMSNIIPMNVLIFKAGYEYWGLGPWIGLKKGYRSSETVKWEGDKAIISLRKLTMEERRKNIPPPPPGRASKEKVILMLKEMDKNLKDLNMEPFNETSWR
ncbi:MAG: hypothetical protein Q7U10_03205 [Thermodesulfovibrionia bacterium]|nr:hypothetical protein [Thermodesulfovibrionia bacterium]